MCGGLHPSVAAVGVSVVLVVWALITLGAVWYHVVRGELACLALLVAAGVHAAGCLALAASVAITAAAPGSLRFPICCLRRRCCCGDDHATAGHAYNLLPTTETAAVATAVWWSSAPFWRRASALCALATASGLVAFSFLLWRASGGHNAAECLRADAGLTIVARRRVILSFAATLLSQVCVWRCGSGVRDCPRQWLSAARALIIVFLGIATLLSTMLPIERIGTHLYARKVYAAAVRPTYRVAFEPAAAIAASAVSPALSVLPLPKGILAPVLAWGPNNQALGLLESISLCRRLGVALLDPWMHRDEHCTGADAVPIAHMYDVGQLVRDGGVHVVSIDAAATACPGGFARLSVWGRHPNDGGDDESEPLPDSYLWKRNRAVSHRAEHVRIAQTLAAPRVRLPSVGNVRDVFDAVFHSAGHRCVEAGIFGATMAPFVLPWEPHPPQHLVDAARFLRPHVCLQPAMHVLGDGTPPPYVAAHIREKEQASCELGDAATPFALCLGVHRVRRVSFAQVRSRLIDLARRYSVEHVFVATMNRRLASWLVQSGGESGSAASNDAANRGVRFFTYDRLLQHVATAQPSRAALDAAGKSCPAEVRGGGEAASGGEASSGAASSGETWDSKDKCAPREDRSNLFASLHEQVTCLGARAFLGTMDSTWSEMVALWREADRQTVGSGRDDTDYEWW